MLYEQAEKKYYRFPSKNSLVDYVENGPVYFPPQSMASKEQPNDNLVIKSKRGDVYEI